MIKKPTTEIVLIKIAKKSGKYPVKLRVTYNRVQKFYPCNIDLTQDEYAKVFKSAKPRKKEKAIRDIATGIESKAKFIIENLKTFDFRIFEKQLYNVPGDNGDVYNLFKKTFDELMNANRVGSAMAYLTVMNSLKKFKPCLSFDDITPQFLNAYENWMLSGSKSITTVGIYLRHLRAIYNTGISLKIASSENYPFGRNKYIIPIGHNIKKALTLEEVGRIFHYPTTDEGWERKAKDFWCFSYMCNGMNIMDIANLKYKDIYDGEIHYERAKTIWTNRGKTNNVIAIPILPEAQAIINRWGNTDLSGENFIFNIITKDMTPIEVKKKVKQFNHNMNRYTKRIALNLQINKNVTSYVARHSFATVLKRSGATVEAISENLGHKNINTTRSYLDSFESESRKKNAKALVAFH